MDDRFYLRKISGAGDHGALVENRSDFFLALLPCVSSVRKPNLAD
jgi:hypothetical protein